MKINLSKVNLNLLLALDAMLKEQHVTRAGQRLHVSQSAMSNVLKQLRETFNDELFVRGQASRMIPTPRAMALKPLLSEALSKINAVFSSGESFDAATTSYTFKLGLSDYTEMVILPKLMQTLTQQAPSIELQVKQMTFIENENIFENDEIDLAIGLFRYLPERLISTPLYHEKSVCVGWEQNPLLQQPITIEQLGNAHHVVILYFQQREQLFSEQILLEHGYRRHVVLTVPSTMAALYSLPNTQLVCFALKSFFTTLSVQLPLAMQALPFSYPPLIISMVWHPKNRLHPAHSWLRQLMIQLFQNVSDE